MLHQVLHLNRLRGIGSVRRTLLAGVIALIAPLAQAQEAARLGFSTERLERINGFMERAVSDGVMAGGQGVIARDGTVVFNQVWGMADREAELPARKDTLYRIYSMTKPITSAALLMLYEEGHFLLEDPVGRYLPELRDLKVYGVDAEGNESLAAPLRQPSIRDLLRHTAGMTYGIFSNTPVDQAYREANLFQAPTLSEFTTRLGQLPLLVEPGTRWHYSVSVDVQGRLIEALSGQSLGEFLSRRVFQPLGMVDTFFVVPEDKQDRLAQLYSPAGTEMDWDSTWQFTPEQRLEPADPELSRGFLEGHLFESGGGGLVSSAADYLRFAQMLANEGELDGVRVLSPRTVRLLRRDHIAGIDQSALRGLDQFGLGVGIVGDQGASGTELSADGAYGWGGAAGTLFWIDPVDNIVGLFMVQSIPHQTPLSQKFRIMTYSALVD